MTIMTLSYDFYIGGTPEQVWNALVSPEGVRALHYGSELRSSFDIGSSMEYIGPGVDGDDTVHIHGTVLEYEPHHVFSHTYKVGTAYGKQHEGFQSRVTYRIEPLGPCTKLSVVHDRWMDGDPSYDNTVRGWRIVLCMLKTLVETGVPLDVPMMH